jgi:hypothetical protein
LLVKNSSSGFELHEDCRQSPGWVGSRRVSGLGSPLSNRMAVGLASRGRTASGLVWWIAEDVFRSRALIS